jgi:hypothetical protein
VEDSSRGPVVINLGVLKQMIVSNVYNENFSDTDEKESAQKAFCKIDGDINLFDNMPADSIEK